MLPELYGAHKGENLCLGRETRNERLCKDSAHRYRHRPRKPVFTIIDYGPDAVLTEIKGDTEKKITPDDSWKAVKGDDANTLRIWAADYDGFIQTFKVQEGYTYRMEIPAGIVQNADGSKNEKIVIEVSGPEASAISGIAAGESVKAEARYNINGQRLNARQKGINIVRMSDGKTVKVVVK